jgi:asparagine synthase (glutamine-hydrolysing)
MCGICGVVQLRGEPREVVDSHRLEWMTSVMEHRGPDDSGYHTAPGVAIGARRLSIVDVADGHQPFSNEDGTIWAAQNGELYEHAAIRTRLSRRGHRFQSRCDTEILPHLYEEHGDDLARELRGMFGFVVWDDPRRRLVVARDRLGIKPMYYATVGDVLVFASELKSLLASGLVEPSLDLEALDAYLSLGFFPGPRTPIAGVAKLMPGHVLTVEDGRVATRAYWHYPEPASERGPQPSAPQTAERLLALLDESVELRLMADVPLGAMLSGGLDSSLIVALMARRSKTPVRTFSIGFAGTGEQNELADAREVSQLWGTEHHEIELALDEPTVDIAELVWHLDEPLADLSSLGFYALCRLARQHVTVALSGQGADELLAGYRKHRAAALSGAYRRMTGAPGMLLARTLARGPESIARPARALGAPDAVSRLLASGAHLDGASRSALARGALAAQDGGAARRAVAGALGGVRAGALPEALYLDAKLGLVDDMLHYFDRASMAHSLEVRVPFLDHHLVEFCATIPAEQKLRRFTESKHVLKLAARGLVPDRIIDKPKIGFFNRSVSAWLQAQAQDSVSSYLLDPGACYTDLLDRGEVERLVRDGRPESTYPVLAILMLEVWMRTFLPRATAAPSTAAA